MILTSLVLLGARIYAAPDAAPIENGAAWIRDGRIAGVGKIAVPADVPRLDC